MARPSMLAATGDLPAHLTRGDVERLTDRALTSSTRVKELVAAMKESGCTVTRDFFKVMNCNTQTGGGYSLEHGVILCYNRLQTGTEVENAMVHELIHAYDHCRKVVEDFGQLPQHACTEVRAAHLSGDCTVPQEVLRGNITANPTSWPGWRRRCVRRRAALSVAMNPGCRSNEDALQAVDEALPACLADTTPFSEGPGVFS